MSCCSARRSMMHELGDDAGDDDGGHRVERRVVGRWIGGSVVGRDVGSSVGDVDRSEDGATVRKTRSSRLSLFSLSLSFCLPLAQPSLPSLRLLPKLKVLTISIVLCRDAFYFQFVSTPEAEAGQNQRRKAHFHRQWLFDCFNQRRIYVRLINQSRTGTGA